MKYQIHDNGGRPFLVKINKTVVDVYVFEQAIDEDHPIFSKQPLISFNAKRVFIGKSPLTVMTSLSGGRGKEFDGNTILLQVADDKYVYIGPTIYEFKTSGKIVKYLSPVGNSDFPYPYATDDTGKTYLMAEKVILSNYKPSFNDNDPYDTYYRNRKDPSISKMKSHKVLVKRQ